MITADQLIATEEEIRLLWEAGELPYLVHLMGGNEHQLVEIFKDIKPTDWVFASHRCHWHWLLHHQEHIFDARTSGDPEFDEEAEQDETIGLGYQDAHAELIERIKEGRSMFLYGPRFVCSAIVAGTASIAAGMALAIKRSGGTERVWHFGGDGCEESGHYSEAVWFVKEQLLPCHFYIEDNDSSCGVSKEQRRGPNFEPRPWPKSHVTRYRYTPTWPHAGSSVRPQLKWKAQ